MDVRKLEDFVVSEFFGDDDKQNAFRDIVLSLLKHYPYHQDLPILRLERHPFTRNILGIDYIEADSLAAVGMFIRHVATHQIKPATSPTGLILWQFHFKDDSLLNYQQPSDLVSDIYPEVVFGEYDGLLMGGSAINNYTYDGITGYNAVSRFYAFLAELYRLPVYYHDVYTNEAGPMMARLKKLKDRYNETLRCG